MNQVIENPNTYFSQLYKGQKPLSETVSKMYCELHVKIQGFIIQHTDSEFESQLLLCF